MLAAILLTDLYLGEFRRYDAVTPGSRPERNLLTQPERPAASFDLETRPVTVRVSDLHRSHPQL
jgi:hypothetical protein